eukprot:g3430.t1
MVTAAKRKKLVAAKRAAEAQFKPAPRLSSSPADETAFSTATATSGASTLPTTTGSNKPKAKAKSAKMNEAGDPSTATKSPPAIITEEMRNPKRFGVQGFAAAVHELLLLASPPVAEAAKAATSTKDTSPQAGAGAANFATTTGVPESDVPVFVAGVPVSAFLDALLFVPEPGSSSAGQMWSSGGATAREHQTQGQDAGRSTHAGPAAMSAPTAVRIREEEFDDDAGLNAKRSRGPRTLKRLDPGKAVIIVRNDADRDRVRSAVKGKLDSLQHLGQEDRQKTGIMAEGGQQGRGVIDSSAAAGAEEGGELRKDDVNHVNIQTVQAASIWQSGGSCEIQDVVCWNFFSQNAACPGCR